MDYTKQLAIVKHRAGLVNGKLNFEEYDDTPENVSASINPNTWDITLSVKHDYTPISDPRRRAYTRKKNIPDAKKQFLEDILLHEVGHWSLPYGSNLGCPTSAYDHDIITEAVTNALPADKKQHAAYVTNAFEDVLDNTRAKQYTGNFAGLVMFFDEQGTKTSEPYTPFYEAFVKTNLFLWGDALDAQLVRRHFTNTDAIDHSITQLINVLHLTEHQTDPRALYNKTQWSSMAATFARTLAPLLDVPPRESLNAHSDAQTGKNNSENSVENYAKTPEGKEEIAHKRYTQGQAPSPNIPKEEQLDLLYQRLARAIPVKAEIMHHSSVLPLAPLRYKAFDPETDNPIKMKAKLYLTDDGITLGAPRETLTIQAKQKTHPRSFPPFKLLLLDTSQSMTEGLDGNSGSTTFIPWGDRSKYHYALLGMYGIEQYLQKQGIAQYVPHGLTVFSDTTEFTQVPYARLAELRRRALTPQFGNTYLQTDQIISALQGKESFVLSLSDGAIQNWDAIKDSFIGLARKQLFAHIQIGSANTFTEDLQSAGLIVHHVTSGEALRKLMIDTTEKTYKGYTQQ